MHQIHLLLSIGSFCCFILFTECTSPKPLQAKGFIRKTVSQPNIDSFGELKINPYITGNNYQFAKAANIDSFSRGNGT